ncbi:MAG: adenine deaminase [Spirochaetales bacterium]|nr:adenine deaminase [Spirochaetales bacterium]
MLTDLILLDASVYNVYLKRWFREDVAVLDGKIFFSGSSSKFGIEAKEVIDCKGQPLIPGLIDIHLHIESTLCSPSEFAKAVLKHGVTTVVSEPHEIANVFGLEGIEEMIRLSRKAVIDIFYGIPSSVPSTNPELETSGGIISLEDMDVLIRNYPEIVCLGEVMNFQGLINQSDRKTEECIRYIQQNFPLTAIEGHCPDITGADLSRVMFAGVDSDHCLQHPESMYERLKLGMFVEIQEKSVRKEIIEYLEKNDVDGLFSFITDDVPPDILISKGHLDHVVRKALALGLSLEKAILASSHSSAARMGFRDRGSISPGKLADMILLKDRSGDFSFERIFKRGKEYCQDEIETCASPLFDNKFKSSMIIDSTDITEEMFCLKTDKPDGSVNCRTMFKNSLTTYTDEKEVTLPVSDSQVLWKDNNLNLVLVLNRYERDLKYSQGLMSGEIFKKGAICSTYAHDSHNILTAGDNEQDMQKAVEWVIGCGGGICVISMGKIIASLELPVGGIISEASVEELSESVNRIQTAMRQLGFNHANPLMSFSTLTLPVSPSLKITDKGLIDVKENRLVDLFL